MVEVITMNFWICKQVCTLSKPTHFCIAVTLKLQITGYREHFCTLLLASEICLQACALMVLTQNVRPDWGLIPLHAAYHSVSVHCSSSSSSSCCCARQLLPRSCGLLVHILCLDRCCSWWFTSLFLILKQITKQIDVVPFHWLYDVGTHWPIDHVLLIATVS